MKYLSIGVPLVASVLSLCVMPAFAGTVAGRVEVGATPIADAVVSIEGAPGAITPGRAIIDQKGKVFVPHVTVVPKGSKIFLVNDDDFLHNTYSRSPALVFNTNQPSQGSRSLITANKAGVIDMRCHIHGQMQAWIIVVDSPYYGATNSRGIFSIRDVPAGTYHIKVWTERNGVLTEVVKVPKEGTVPVIVKYAAK
ncbi:MAG TPA: methylamine utilization protein [Armatimonadota bacterium]|nr:methylamine utilization protein [Armatimonadota bacterium]